MARRAVGGGGAHDARVEPWRPAGSREARRRGGDRSGFQQPVRSLVDLLARGLPRVSRYRGQIAGDRPMRGGPTLVVGLAVTMLAGMPTRAASQQEPRA